MAKLKLAIVTPVHWSHAVGGAEYQMQQIEAALLERRDEVEFRVFAGKVGASAPDYVQCVGAQHALAKYSRLFDVGRLSKALTDYAPDRVYQRVSGVYTAVACWLKPSLKYQLFWHLSSDSDLDTSPIPVSLKWPIRVLERHLMTQHWHQVDRIIAQTQPQQLLANERLGGAMPCEVVANFHPEPEALSEALPVDDGKQRVLWVANLKPLKRPEKFLALAQHFADLPKSPDYPEVEFVMIGALQASPEQSRRWQAQIASLPNLSYCGPLPQAEVNRRLSTAAVLINTSDYEGLPNTFIQAWMRGVPVLSLNVDPGGAMAREQIGHACGTQAQLVQTLEALLQDPVIRFQMGQRSREFALYEYGQRNLSRLMSRLLSSETA